MIEFKTNQKGIVEAYKDGEYEGVIITTSGDLEYEKQLDSIATRNSRIRGSLIGGAAGDALGFSVEFIDINAIKRLFGENGITEYSIDKLAHKAVISDDTQMTLFTACGILIGAARFADRGVAGSPSSYMRYTYHDWRLTQGYSDKEYIPRSWITSIPELNHRRAPGNTCLSALRSKKEGTLSDPINSSKGCGGIMRVAPIGLYFTKEHDMHNYEYLLRDTAESVAITHGHPLGYLPAAAFVYILHEILEDKVNNKKDLIDTAVDAVDLCSSVFKDVPDKHIDELKRINQLAIELALGDENDLSNICKIGEGWVAEETYGVALYCCIRHFGDFSNTIRSAVNHSGDSDSTGAVAGNIMGAIVGYSGIDDNWKNDLELRTIILEIADDLSDLERIGHGTYREREDKYIYGINPYL